MAVPLSNDHKPFNILEKNRIIKNIEKENKGNQQMIDK